MRTFAALTSPRACGDVQLSYAPALARALFWRTHARGSLFKDGLFRMRQDISGHHHPGSPDLAGWYGPLVNQILDGFGVYVKDGCRLNHAHGWFVHGVSPLVEPVAVASGSAELRRLDTFQRQMIAGT